MALLNEVGDGAGGLADRDGLLGQVVAQGVAAQGDDDAFTHDKSTFHKVLEYKGGQGVLGGIRRTKNGAARPHIGIYLRTGRTE
ncbi:hypothetical protein CE91St41_02090 [Oscillospiraceae bacterium]|nr:hypothetical protein CE91St40_02090 [Oscillospiraceae bacterium]BDF73320.1 hypothetical protein CE91St41_02090 [Oscillospiraceae bacterium]